MNKTSIVTIACGALLAAAGCTSNQFYSDNLVESGQWHGRLGIVGHLNEFTIESGSNLSKLSVVGDANVIHVMDRVTLGKVELWGENNKVYVPAHLVLRKAVVGSGSEIIPLRPGDTPVMPGQLASDEQDISYEPPLESSDDGE